MSEKKIAVVGLTSSENLGEKFISQSLSWLIKESIREIDPDRIIRIEEVDLEGRKERIIAGKSFAGNRIQNYEFYKIYGIPTEMFYILLKKVVHRVKNIRIRNLISIIRHIIWKYSVNLKRRSRKYFQQKLSNIKLIVVDGAGLLEYSRNEYQEYMDTLCEYAEQNGIPVVFNAIGRSGEFEENDYRCKILKRVFEYPCVKYVSARDSVENVQACVPKSMNVRLCADAAFWMDKAYGVRHEKNTGVIGIGLIRSNALMSYGYPFDEEDWIELFIGIAKELDKRGFKYRFFTNGFLQDYILGKKICKRLNLGSNVLVKRPVDDKVLANTINSFDGLITCRMHSSIAAFTMGIPSVVLSWNKKIDKYMEIIGYPDRAIDVKDFTPDYIVDKYLDAYREGISEETMKKMKELAKSSVLEYVDMV